MGQVPHCTGIREEKVVCLVQSNKERKKRKEVKAFLQRPLADHDHGSSSSAAPHCHLNRLSTGYRVNTVRGERRRAMSGSGGCVGGHGAGLAGHHTSARRGGCGIACGCTRRGSSSTCRGLSGRGSSRRSIHSRGGDGARTSDAAGHRGIRGLADSGGGHRSIGLIQVLHLILI
ncbi:hypothetical protein BCR43DRAFT_498492 [Syncephalastrum racemosum]|uniref:Uncharacterized protein n=1 Tax=Syncephalastrum racemosum TaxID=13706 RepID=A0A1X2H150_SYNRA|nr:hypothetical protein BCR43DRAFT_498492 [Syncephalastrum racemosum]